MFALLTFLGQKSVASGRGSQVIDAILRVLSAQLHGHSSTSGTTAASTTTGPPHGPATNNPNWQPWHSLGTHVDTHLVSWLLLYLSLCLDALTPPRKSDSDKNKENG